MSKYNFQPENAQKKSPKWTRRGNQAKHWGVLIGTSIVPIDTWGVPINTCELGPKMVSLSLGLSNSIF